MEGLFKPALSGCPFPMGASLVERSQASLSSSAAAASLVVNFAVFSSAATSVRLCLFSRADLDAGRTTAELELDPLLNRTGDVWHAMLEVEDAELMYGYRMSGPNQEKGGGGDGGGEGGGAGAGAAPSAAPGHRFDESVVLLDPYATSIIGRARFGELGPEGLDYGGAALGLARTWPQAACGLPSAGGGAEEDEAPFDWEGDRPLRTPMEDLVIYEMHVRGFTAHPSSGFRSEGEEAGAAETAPTASSSSSPLRGTYAALTEKLDYISSLGVNAIELLPVHEFNELEYYAVLPGSDGEESGAIRLNYWGYSTVGFFAPMARFSSAAAAAAPKGQKKPKSGSSSGRAVIREFKEMVKACHSRGIEVIMDVVFNHTAEGNEKGPSLSFRYDF
jgi:isoamylase